MVELSGDGTYWNINTAGIFKTSYGANRTVVYNRHTTANQPAETDEASLSGEQSGTTPLTRMNTPAQTADISDSKGKGNSSTSQEQTEKVVKDKTPNANSTQAALAAAEQETNTEPTEAQKEVAFSTGNVKGKTDGKGKTKPFEEFSEGERTLQQKIKATVLRLLDKFHGSLKLPKWFELGDNELRYILWRSKERLERGKEHPIDLARDIVKRKELGLGEDNTLYSETKKDAHPTRLQTSDDAQAVQRDVHLSGTKVEINSENREEIEAARAAAVERRKAESVQQDGDAEAGSGGSENTGGSGRSTKETPTERELADNLRSRERQHQEKILPNLGNKYSLSAEQANNGELFYQDAEGNTNLAVIPDEIFERLGLSPVPLNLTETMGWYVY